MPEDTTDKVLKEVHDLHQVMQDQGKTLNERMQNAEQLAKDAVENLQAFRRQFVSPATPIADDQAVYAQQRGGLFDGKMQIPYQRMISLAPSSPALAPKDVERLKLVQDLHDAVCIRWDFIKKTKPDQAGGDWMLKKMWESSDFKLYAQHLVDAGYLKAANDILNPIGGAGVNLDFTLLSAQLIDLVRIEAIVASQFQSVPLTRAKQEFPALRGDTRALLGGTTLPVTDADNISGGPPSAFRVNPTLGQVAFDAVHCLGFLMYTDDMIEDSVVPLLPMLRNQAAIMIARALDAAIINGDDTASHMDSDTTAASDFRKAWDGLRKLGENAEILQSGEPILSAHIPEMLLKMGKFGTSVDQCVLIIAAQEYLKLLADPDLKTVDRIGIDRATLRTGVIDRIYGVDVVISGDVRRDLNTGGVYDGTTTNNTIEIIARRDRFWLGIKHDVRLEQVRAAQALANWIQADLRCDWQAIDKNDTDNVFAGGLSDYPLAISTDVSV